MMKRVKYTAGFLFLFMGLLVGIQLGFRSLSGERFVNVQELIQTSEREIANVKSLKKPKFPLLLSTSPLRVLTAAQRKIPPQGSDEPIEITLGHFSIIRSHDNISVFACQIYDEVTLTYEALSLNADKTLKIEEPLMMIKAPCAIDFKDPLHLKAIQLIPKNITKDPPGDGMRTSEDGSYSLHFEKMEEQWPSTWRFKSVQLKASKGNAPSQELSRSELPLTEQSKLDLYWVNESL